MHSARRTIGVLGLAASLAAPAMAQDSKELVIQVRGGGLASLAPLDRNGAWDTKMSASFSGGVGLRVVDRLVARVDVAYAASPIQFRGADFNADLTRLFASAMAQIQFPRSSGLNPYFLLGGGITFLNQHTTADPKKQAGHAVGGAGVAYRLGGGGLSILAEGRVYVYQARGMVGSSLENPRVLWDGSFGAGLSYAFGLGAR